MACEDVGFAAVYRVRLYGYEQFEVKNICMCMCVCISIYIYIYTYIHTYICIGILMRGAVL